MTYDFAIIGAGIAGASVAAEISPHGRTLMLEAEDMPGYHSTGRSAAFWAETYGGPDLQPLTTASRDLLASPPPEFAERPFLEQRGKLHVARVGEEAILDSFLADFEGSGVTLEKLGRAALLEALPGTRAEWVAAVAEPSCADIDVAGLHQAYLRAARGGGAEITCSARIETIEREGEGWKISAGDRSWQAKTIINAAGAWADNIAEMAGARPLGITPLRRTVLQLRTDPKPPENLPLVIDASGSFYFRGEGADRLWLSPHDETPDIARDVAPEELDVALAIDRFEKVVDWKVSAIERKWAGLRSFAPDRLPVYGFDSKVAGFFWCAGQGGSGIQTSPAYASLCKALLLSQAPADRIRNVDPERYAPSRFD